MRMRGVRLSLDTLCVVAPVINRLLLALEMYTFINKYMYICVFYLYLFLYVINTIGAPDDTRLLLALKMLVVAVDTVTVANRDAAAPAANGGGGGGGGEDAC